MMLARTYRSVAAASGPDAAAIVFWGACLVLSILVVPAAARVLPVGAGESLAAAVARAADGDTILLGAGSFKETIEITRGVCLLGAGVGRTVLTHPGQEVVRVKAGSRAGDLRAELVALTVRDARAGIVIDGGDLHLADCQVEDCTDFGLSVRGPARVELERSEIFDHRVGVLAREGADLRLNECEIRGNEIGIEIDGAAGLVSASSLTANQLGAVVRGTGRLVLGDRPGAGNRLVKNRQGTVRNLTSIPVAARYNYWGGLDCAFARGFTGPVRYLPFMNLALDDSVTACP
jgi:hypothetical protein